MANKTKTKGVVREVKRVLASPNFLALIPAVS